MELDWNKNIYEWISSFSEINYMSERWLGFDKENASYFGEDLNILFDDLCFDDFIEEMRNETIDKSLLDAIINFRNSLFYYEEPKSGLAIDILNDPKYLTIVDNAKTVVKTWNIPK